MERRWKEGGKKVERRWKEGGNKVERRWKEGGKLAIGRFDYGRNGRNGRNETYLLDPIGSYWILLDPAQVLRGAGRILDAVLTTNLPQLTKFVDPWSQISSNKFK